MTTTTMTPVDWAKRPIQKYAVFSGRAPRSEFWWYCLLVFLASIVAMIVESAAGLSPILYPYGPLTILILLATFIPSLAVQVRRLHDRNRSGLWLLAFYVPYIGFIATMPGASGLTGGGPDMGLAAMAGLLSLVVLGIGIALLVFFILPGTPGDNRYGPNPLGNTASTATV